MVSPEIRRRMLEIARQFRKQPTKSENILWQALRGKKLDGIKFRRQQPIGNFIVDFYNSVYRLVVEVDGYIHDEQVELDHTRQEILEQLGLNVLRVKAKDVERNLPSVLAAIRSKISELKINTGESSSLLVGEGLRERQEDENKEGGTMTTNTASWIEKDKKQLHPVYHPKSHANPLVVERGEGVWLYTTDGQKILDGMAGCGTSMRDTDAKNSLKLPTTR